MPEDKSKIKTRIINSVEIRKIDKESRVVEFVASDSSVDSYGTSVPVDKWDLEAFNSNGIIGYMHDVYSSANADPDSVIGKGQARVEDDKLVVSIEFEPKDLNEKADKIFRKIEWGSLKAVSVGFMPTASGHWGNEKDMEDPNVYYYNGQRLLEVSVVNIPANPNALRRSIDEEMAALPEKPAKVEDKTNESKAVGAEENILLTAKAAMALAKFHQR